MQRIPWVDRKTNELIFLEADENNKLIREKLDVNSKDAQSKVCGK